MLIFVGICRRTKGNNSVKDILQECLFLNKHSVCILGKNEDRGTGTRNWWLHSVPRDQVHI